MKSKCKILIEFLLALLLVMFIVGCDGVFEPEEAKKGSKENPIVLTVNEWTNGEIILPDNGGIGDQWFKFTATTSFQRIYIKLGTMTHLDAYLYDSDFYQIGETLIVQGDSGRIVGEYASFSLKAGKTYYISVSGMYFGYYEYSGTYKIGFTDFPAQPETVITELSSDTWINGEVIHPNEGGIGEQWFKFTSTASNQYVLIKPGTMTYLNAYLYSKDFNEIGRVFEPYLNSLKKESWSLNMGETYYILVSGMSFGSYEYSGTYQIAFNSTGEEPM